MNFSANEVDNVLKHTRGAISMARSQDYDSASSQFYRSSNFNVEYESLLTVCRFIMYMKVWML